MSKEKDRKSSLFRENTLEKEVDKKNKGDVFSLNGLFLFYEEISFFLSGFSLR